MNPLKSLNTTKFLYSTKGKNDDFSFWKQLSKPVHIKENSVIDYIDFSPIQPHNFAVTCSVRIQIYNPITKDPTGTVSHFQKNAHGGTFGKSGQLLVCGDDEGYVKLFETATKRKLRTYTQHTASVHRAFITTDTKRIVSFSDDMTVRLWDMTEEKCITTFDNAHTGYIRAGCVSPVSPDILLSGGYDGKIVMYDTRTNSNVFEVDHGSTVHSVIFLPTGGLFVSCGTSHVKLWDAFAGGRFIGTMSTHTKDITCLRLACNGRRLLSGGLDRKVKIYDTTVYQEVHSLDFPNGITSMAVAPDDETLVVGMTDGIVSIQRMESDRKIKTIEKRKVPKVMDTGDQFVANYKREKEAKHITHLRKYEYALALNDVLNTQCMNKTPHVTVELMAELMRRKGLGRAITNQHLRLNDQSQGQSKRKGKSNDEDQSNDQCKSNEFLVKLISFIIRYIGDHRFMKKLIDVSNILLDTYQDDFVNLNGDVARKFLELNKALRREESLVFECLQLQGAFKSLLSGADVSKKSSNIIEFGRELNKLTPSGKENFVINVDD